MSKLVLKTVGKITHAGWLLSGLKGMILLLLAIRFLFRCGGLRLLPSLDYVLPCCAHACERIVVSISSSTYVR